MESSINFVNRRFSQMKKSLSPSVANVQIHMDVFQERNSDDIKLPAAGYINYHLCLNAQTKEPHTECDSSYTIISVPNQTLGVTNKGFRNHGSFEMIVNSEITIVVPMKIGTVLTYSGYLLTHRQQIRNEDLDVSPFVNIVSYNSKRLFENMMESFRRYIRNI